MCPVEKYPSSLLFGRDRKEFVFESTKQRFLEDSNPTSRRFFS